MLQLMILPPRDSIIQRRRPLAQPTPLRSGLLLLSFRAIVLAEGLLARATDVERNGLDAGGVGRLGGACGVPPDVIVGFDAQRPGLVRIDRLFTLI